MRFSLGEHPHGEQRMVAHAFQLQMCVVWRLVRSTFRRFAKSAARCELLLLLLRCCHALLRALYALQVRRCDDSEHQRRRARSRELEHMSAAKACKLPDIAMFQG